MITPTRNLTGKAETKPTIHSMRIFISFLAAGFFLFWPVIGKGFVSDDYSILYRVVYQKVFYMGVFFRPLSDISLYFSWRLGGFNPVYFNAVNIAIHATNSFLIYVLCQKFEFLERESRGFVASIAAILFLIYPYHNEAIVWVIARGIVLSGFFGILSVLALYFNFRPTLKYLLSGVCYFAALCGYETILFLPFIALILLYARDRSMKNLIAPALIYLVALLANLLFRMIVIGGLRNGYGNRVFELSRVSDFLKLPKGFARLLVPPSENSLLLTFCAIILLVFLIGIALWVYRRGPKQRAIAGLLAMSTLIAALLPVCFGVSTKTFEGDRVFYFASFLLCVLLAYVISLVKRKQLRYGLATLLLLYFASFFYLSLFAWKKSANMAADILSFSVKHVQKSGKLYVINLPEEYKGVPVFRNGFNEALLMSDVDTAMVTAVNHIPGSVMAALRDTITPEQNEKGIYIYPSTIIKPGVISSAVLSHPGVPDTLSYFKTASDRIVYWNGKHLRLLE